MPDSENEARVRAVLVAAFPPVDVATSSFVPAARPRTARVVGSMLAAAAIVAAIAIVIAVTRTSSNSPKPALPPTPSPSPSVTSQSRTVKPVPTNLEGTRWLLTKLTSSHGTINVATAYPSTQTTGTAGAWLHLSRNGAIGAEDTVNFSSGKFVLTGDQLEVAPGGETLAGYGGNDAGRLEIIAAIDGVFSNGDAIDVTGTTDQLVLTSGEYVLTFKNDGSLADDPAPPASLVPPTPGTPNIAATACPSQSAIRQLTGDQSLSRPEQDANHHSLNCRYQGVGDSDLLTVFVKQGSAEYDTYLQQAEVGTGITLTHPQIGDRAFRAASKEGTQPTDNFGVQQGNDVVFIACVGPSANLDAELAVARALLH